MPLHAVRIAPDGPGPLQLGGAGIRDHEHAAVGCPHAAEPHQSRRLHQDVLAALAYGETGDADRDPRGAYGDDSEHSARAPAVSAPGMLEMPRAGGTRRRSLRA